MENCLFCKIINKEIPATIIYEDTEFIAFLDKFPTTYGHVLILPKTHIENIFHMDEETSGKLFALATKISKHIKPILGFDHMNILQNNGTLAGQTIFHFHIHLLPRYEPNDKKDSLQIAFDSKEATDEALQELKSKLSLS